MGYGDGDEATVIDFGINISNKHITSYFRHSFTLSDPSDIHELVVNLIRDDGAAVYLNGVEVERSNLAPNAGPDDFAVSSVSGPGESFFYEFEVPVRA